MTVRPPHVAQDASEPLPACAGIGESAQGNLEAKAHRLEHAQQKPSRRHNASRDRHGPHRPWVDHVPGVPSKVVLAKFRRCAARGLVDGCDCGCRGDWELTNKGKALLERPERMTEAQKLYDGMTDPDRAVFVAKVREAIAPTIAPKLRCNCGTCIAITATFAAEAAINAMVAHFGPGF